MILYLKCIFPIFWFEQFINRTYHPAAAISVHVAVDLNRFGLVIVDIDGVDAALLVAILHDLKTVHGEGIQEANYRRGYNVNIKI